MMLQSPPALRGTEKSQLEQVHAYLYRMSQWGKGGLHIPLMAEDTGNSYGRTIEFYPETSELLVKAVGKSIYKI